MQMNKENCNCISSLIPWSRLQNFEMLEIQISVNIQNFEMLEIQISVNIYYSGQVWGLQKGLFTRSYKGSWLCTCHFLQG